MYFDLVHPRCFKGVGVFVVFILSVYLLVSACCLSRTGQCISHFHFLHIYSLVTTIPKVFGRHWHVFTPTSMKCEKFMYLAAGLNPFPILNVYLSRHNLLVVTVTCVSLSVLWIGLILCVFSLTYGWMCVQYKSVCIWGRVTGHIWSMMTAGIQTGPDNSSLQVLYEDNCHHVNILSMVMFSRYNADHYFSVLACRHC